jgi:hypothetical protein
MLKSGETLFCKVTNVSLVEERRGKGHYQGGSTGFSIPVGSVGGRSVRYRIGASRGHYVQGAPSPTAIDTGTMFVTNQRVVFRGTKQTRECAFAKLIGFQHSVDGSTTFSVSNRQKPTTIHYGPSISDCSISASIWPSLISGGRSGTSWPSCKPIWPSSTQNAPWRRPG